MASITLVTLLTAPEYRDVLLWISTTSGTYRVRAVQVHDDLVEVKDKDGAIGWIMLDHIVRVSLSECMGFE